MTRRAATALLVVVLGLQTTTNAATYNYTDTTFVNADWTGVKFADTSTPTGSFTAGQANPGGSPILPGPNTADYRAITHDFGGGAAGAINVTYQGNLFNWTPGAGETASTVSYTYDVIFYDQTTAQNFGAIGFSPAIFQGGSVYRLASYDNVFGASGWQRFAATGIPLTSFIKMDPTTAGLSAGSPTVAGSMSFGFVSANSANQFVTKSGGLDNYGFTLNTKVTPEPTSIAVIGLGTTLLRRRRFA